ncbi:hypothetical protein PILCRDRAFT_12787 [Piloderma croceum F 1598]|uniref:Uncharacterized protein n=1 Tax=Piloderma croceum (strain F 1598) TaxID=765440 RepID=A0A0C3BG64_PILCF|nr:hypothetical protein PILCRDRAFT_12787 [Piloderma croceum F 1598]
MATTTVAELHLLVTYKKYTRSCIHASDLLKAAMRQMMHQLGANRRPIVSHGLSSSLATTSTIVNTPSTCTLDCLPPFTAAERALLVEHEGCFKCLHFYTNHKSADCPNGFPNKLSYAPLTEAQALAMKKKSGKKEKTPVTAVVTPTAVVMPSAVLDDGSDSEYVDTPFFTPHFFFSCSIGGFTATSTK